MPNTSIKAGAQVNERNGRSKANEFAQAQYSEEIPKRNSNQKGILSVCESSPQKGNSGRRKKTNCRNKVERHPFEHTETEVESIPAAGLKTGAEESTKTNAKEAEKANTGAETQTAAKSKANAKATTEATAKGNAKAEADANAKVNTNAKANASANAKAKAEAKGEQANAEFERSVP